MAGKDRGKLVVWFQSNQTRIQEEQWSCAQAAKIAAADLGFEVTEGNMSGIASMKKDAMFPFEWPRTATQTRRSPDGRLDIVIQVVEKMRREYDITLEGELATLWESLVKETT